MKGGIAPSVVLANSQFASAFGMHQVQAGALLFELVTAVLILQSTFLPRWLGWWLVAGGIGGLTSLWPTLATSIWPLLVAAGAGELALPAWLLMKGVDISKWRALQDA